MATEFPSREKPPHGRFRPIEPGESLCYTPCASAGGKNFLRRKLAKYRIAWMPGDGIGQDVMEAARIVLDKIGLDAEYPPADIGWEFWRREGDALPQRTIDLLRTCNCALFGAITSKPKEEAAAELNPALRGKGLSTAARSSACASCSTCTSTCARARPIPATRSTTAKGSTWWFSARTPRISMPGWSSTRCRTDVRAALEANSPAMAAFRKTASEDIALSCRILTRAGCRRIVRGAFEYARDRRLPERDAGGKAQRGARDLRVDHARSAQDRRRVPGHPAVGSQRGRDDHVAGEEPARITACW